MFIPIKPVAKPRQSRQDRWNPRPIVVRYRQFCDDLRAAFPYPLPDQLWLIFYIGMPASWSNKKRAATEGQPHQVRPDVDNYSKAVMDALSSREALASDDGHVYILHAEKYWGAQPGIHFIDFP
jgi:Holliday junction resolvase RusA-like endonuclease